ncbi:putative disease resistance RPP8-like protein 2 isoform X2 [Salvia divinorum]|uniref:Disease resistance RPP8-like protein 2 isoform X2 n=1 Tax=Salvia divinorum TaxID=28513 RepID=A0ABD1GIZ3_SALDI
MDASHTAEDVIESYIIDTIQLSAAAPTDDDGDEQISCIHFYQDMQNVIEEMDLIKKEVTELTREKGLMMCCLSSWIGLPEDVPADKSSLS